MSSLKKILIIPSWYPTHNDPSLGIFFKVQAEMFCKNSVFDIKVLPYSLTTVGRRELIKRILRGRFNVFSKSRNDIDLSLFEITVKVNHIAYSARKYSELKNIKNTYFKLLSQFIDLGWKPDLIHAHDVHWGGAIANYIYEQLRIPYIITQHKPIYFNFIDSFTQKEFVSAFKNARQVLTVSNYDLRLLTSAAVNNSIQSVGNLVDENLFPLKTEQQDQSKFVIYTVGSLSYRKDYFTFLKALHYLIYTLEEKNIEVIINYVGQYEDNFTMVQLKQLVDEYSLSAYCKFTSKIPIDKMFNYYHSASVYVQTSIYETFGLAVAEALVCGTPVVAIDNGGIRDIYNGENMVLKEIGDYKGIAEGIASIKRKSVIFDPNDLRNSVINKFGMDAFKERIGNIYLNNLDVAQHD
mgnify:CR=1 FL=1